LTTVERGELTLEKLKPITQIEIKFDDGTQEICKVMKRFYNGDYQIKRKERNRIELVSYYDTDYLIYKNKDKYMWVEAFLKNKKGYEQVLIRRIEE
jgi:hypothetical protein